ncbi:hypothetical protein P7228_14615 [Altererythrobacter arenosus]|uniref:Uracil-DNA glycosylase-like domain-containing protein n=1 Tax=Altererythrobacter arenosus TaxID=3032592 RepID=A0ABY8FQD9_9SPHN|nr:uracil-DNA glycosylase family protein [Altererythrobacter sp. CAU 1644]WFL77205.1 hypothetical protein P7228_14615 [Altererythrobacter sp. CAU 1644]
MDDQNPLDASDIAAAFDWWRDAGVDLDFSDDATDWLAAAAPAEAAPEPAVAVRKSAPEQAAAPAEKIALLGPQPPTTLEAFREFWLTAPGLDAIGPRGRIAPWGAASPDLMFLVTDPEEQDSDKLLSGPQGRLLSRIIAAMGFEEDAVYLASALPRHTPMADGATLAQSGLGEVLLHHVGLVAPRRIVAFGANLPPLLGHNAAQGPHSLREINHDGRSIPILVAEGLESMMAMPRLKARFWHRWLDWTAD